MAKNKKKTVAYNITRKKAVKEFEQVLANISDVSVALSSSIACAENSLDDIENGDSRKSVAKDLEQIYSDLRKLNDQLSGFAEEFGICIDNFVDVKHD